MTRREMFQAPLLCWTERKNELKHHQDIRLYHGPIELPPNVMEKMRDAPDYRTTHRKPAVRFKTGGITYLFREWAPTPYYLGEVVQTQARTIRVHLWRVTDRGRPIVQILERCGEPRPA